MGSDCTRSFMGTKGAQSKILSTVHSNTDLNSNPVPTTNPKPNPSPHPDPSQGHGKPSPNHGKGGHANPPSPQKRAGIAYGGDIQSIGTDH